ncbi:Stk1 family PASTA domain-containing Ser/Thr kinase [Aeromicrobium duanguangcaii]|uniref:Stk1 family PASTA domain-containing Ser/Thr kinase n=1 Tax=Aeromicrobium duanguangcaii TaxID=2968086 RepID=UPI0020181246|nr:Stk1 family PASTA domain-containing Ser/Thr kinase [Aeromicrobium duanguangcaii]MCL3836738.1 Stk1 family PASTA domain-containing Ser/Thr kinase [Aeromicrobium duanguangcaii]
MTVTDDNALVGRTLDQRYVIHERIARGGMASVFRATDLRLDRVVAVKIMHPDTDLAEAPERFVREAQSAAKLNHRGIVSVYDQGVDGDTVYLVMEYVPGRTLRDVLREEAPMPPRRALSYLEPVLMALSAAHDARLIHRDIKPENVLISTTGEVKLADFGLARAISTESTLDGVLVGTVSYLAPEVITHQGADPRTDVYACGAMLFEMLTSTKPHVGDSPLAVAHLHVNEDVKPPSTLQPGIPPYLDALVMRAMTRDRGRRSPDARVLLHQVRQVQRALAAGLADDPDLTADLLPGAGPTPAEMPTLDRLPADVELTAPVASWMDGPPTRATTSVNEPTTTFGAAPPAATVPPAAAVATPRSRRGPVLLMAAVAALAATALLGWYLAIGRYEIVPNLVSMDRQEAVEAAEAAGFTVEIGDPAFSEVVEKGAVVSTDPDAGSRLLPDEPITVTLSKGKERYEIPNIQGRTVAEAETILGALHLRVGEVTEEFSDKVPTDGIIKSSSHKVGDQVKRDTEVDLVVSKGPRPIEIEDHAGDEADEAKAELEGQGFTVRTVEENSDSVKKGRVISQTPSSGTGVRGDTITLTVSQGPPLVAVPDLKGKTEDEARAALEALGLKLNAARNPFAGGDAKVQYQMTDAGKKIKRGSTVTVFLS